MSTCLARNVHSRMLLAVALILSLSAQLWAQDAHSVQYEEPQVGPGYMAPEGGDAQSDATLTAEQLDQLLGPVALYPDPLLAQVLAAATYPMDIVQAVRLLDTTDDPSQLDQMDLDPSVQALARFPDTLRMMDEELDWTNALGAAFLHQQPEVMAAVQRLRAQAISSGALQDTPQQEIYTEEGFVGIVPADPEVIYVPQYVPEVVYGWVDPPIVSYDSYVSFGVGCHTGSWLNLGFNWGRGCLSYHSWPIHRHGFVHGGFGGGHRFGRAYYRSSSWGRAWHRSRRGSPHPRFRGGHDRFRGGRGFSSLRGGLGNRSGNRSSGRFTRGTRGSRDGFGNSGRGGSRGGFRNTPRTSGRLGAFTDNTRFGTRGRQGSAGINRGPRGGGAIGENRPRNTFGGNRVGSGGISPRSSVGNRNGSSPRTFGNRSGTTPRSVGRMPRYSGGRSGGSAIRAGGSRFSSGPRIQSRSGGSRPSAGSAIRSGGSRFSSGPRIQSRSRGPSFRSPASGSNRGSRMRSSGMRSGGSRSSGMRNSGSRGSSRSSGMRSSGSRGRGRGR